MPNTTASSIIGRHHQIAEIDAFLSDASSEPGALLIEGEAGIGKSTLFQHAAATAAAAGDVVLLGRPAESERDLALAALVDLLTRVPERAVAALPDAQARVLKLLLQREDGRFDRLSLSVATVAVIAAAAATARVVVAIDDVQWLDPSSAAVLSYAFRRLAGAPVRTILVRRADRPGPWPLDLERSLPDERRVVVRVGPLDPADLGRILRRRLGWAPAWPRVVRIAELSGGNPFYALEIARTRGSVRSDDDLDELVPERLADLVRSRVARLPAGARSVVEAASVLRSPTVDVVRRLVPASVDVDRAIAEAERASVLAAAGGHLTFEHPIVASAAYRSIPTLRAKDLHRAAAALVDDAEERARHLAAAADGPEETLAATLADAAERAWRRGAPDAAADLLAAACRMTPPEHREALGSRRIALGRLTHSAGDAPGAIAELRSVIAEWPPGRVRALALYHLMYVTRLSGSLEEAVAYGQQAVLEAEDDPSLQAEIYELLSRLADTDMELKLDAARKGLDAVARIPDPDPEVAFYARAAMVEAEFLAGLGIHLDALGPPPAEVRPRFPPIRAAVHADDLIGRLLVFDGRIDEGLAVLRGFDERAAVESRSALVAVLAWMAEGEILAGRFPAAVEVGEEGLERAAETGAEDPWGKGFHALALARLGRLREARSLATDVAERSVADAADDMDRSPALLALGVVAMAEGRAEEAVEHLATLDRMKRQAGIREPRSCAHAGEYVEALVAAGRPDEAERALVSLEEDAERSSAASAQAIAARCRALLAAARGDLDDARAWADRSLQRFESLPMPFERARALLLAGQIHRRRKEKRLARQALDEAVEAFDALETPAWAERARAELARIPLRTAPADLTPTEQRIAELAAAGLTNRQIAERTFVSPKTVEANLARAYRKLGIRSRAELGRLMAFRPTVET